VYRDLMLIDKVLDWAIETRTVPADSAFNMA
jgi:hypothetical protein